MTDEYNEGWDEIVNHLLDEVGMKSLKFEIVVTSWGDGSGDGSAVDTNFAIFNNGFKVKYARWCKDVRYVYPADDYDTLLTLSEKTKRKFTKEVARLDALEKKKEEKEKIEGMARKSSFIKEWYTKKFGMDKNDKVGL